MSAATLTKGPHDMSDLVDRYLGAVAALLPKDSRQDIVAELRDLIVNRVEEREAALSRPLDKREIEALLREIGHPIAVAGRYGPRTALIGPEIYPFWLFGVKVLLAVAALAAVIPAGVALLTAHGDARLVARTFNDFIPTALSLIGAATLIGAAIERGWIKTDGFKNWKVNDLPKVPKTKKWFFESLFEGLFEVAVTLLFIGWWTKLVDFPDSNVIATRDGEIVLSFSPIFQTLYWPILVMAVVQVMSGLILVVKPGWVRARAGFEIVGGLIGLAIAAALWPAMPLVTLVAPEATVAGLANLQRTVEMSLQIGLWVAVAIILLKLIIDGWRLIRGR
ncbi:hypothetical protein CA606_00345 [Caulobacter vibrioides]|uniref:Uncharacterized protein n=1 Tax=Caulobacter vibrioides TaxID=155892 RepID=A0A290MM74_CAUVI|nr:hypothetical protein CA606_00345 [Caulobacter vibrioides]